MQRALAISVLCALGACTDEPEPTGPFLTSVIRDYGFPAFIPPQLDVLVVVDNTTAMAPYASSLATLAAATEQGLFVEGTAQPDARIAVTTTDGSGSLRMPATSSESYLAVGFDAHYNATRNFTGSLTDALADLFAVGTATTSPPRPLAAVVNALGFARADSFLGIVMITASDDASDDHPVAYSTMVKGQRDDYGEIGLSGVYPQPSARLDAFAGRFAPKAWLTDIATGDSAKAIVSFENALKRILFLPCADEPSDVDAETEGPQYDCSFAAQYDDGTSEQLPPCRPDSAGRCFEFVEHMWCDGGSKLFNVRGFPGHHSPQIRGQCVVIPEI